MLHAGPFERVLLLTLMLALPACGGGGGGNGNAAPPTLSASTNVVSATVSPTAGTPGLQVNLSIANPPQSAFYYQTTFGGAAVSSANIIWQPNSASGAESGALEIMLFSPAFIGSGTYHDTVTAYVCTDSKCVDQIQGSPVSVSVVYTVTGNSVSDATYALVPTTIALETPSNAPAPSVPVNVTAYDVPPYGAYVFQASENGGPIAGMTFKQTSASAEPYAYGTGVLTVNMKSPATLGPGFYNDLITLSICYDTACTKPAVGSPFEIPVTYTVTASAGQEFQEQIIDQNLTALVVDATGQILYGVTAPSTANSVNMTPAQLLEINPVSGAVTSLISLPAAVSQIEVSQDGAYLYLLTEPWSTQQLTPPIEVLRVRTSNMSIDQTVALTNIIVSPAQIAVSPVDSNTWSAAFPYQPGIWYVDIFDGQVARPNVWSVNSNVVERNEAIWSSDASTMYILDANLNSVPVSTSGLGAGTQLQAGSAGQGGFNEGGNLQLAGGLIYSDSGGVLDPKTSAVIGQYSLPFGVLYAERTIDTVNNRTFAAYIATDTATPQGTIESFNLSTFTRMWITRLPIGTRPLRWGSNGLAWIGPGASQGQQALYLINGTFVAP